MGIIVGGVKAPEVNEHVVDDVVNDEVKVDDVVESADSGDAKEVESEEVPEKKTVRRRKSRR